MTYTYKDIVANKVILVVKALSYAQADRIFEERFGYNPWTNKNIHIITEQ